MFVGGVGAHFSIKRALSYVLGSEFTAWAKTKRTGFFEDHLREELFDESSRGFFQRATNPGIYCVNRIKACSAIHALHQKKTQRCLIIFDGCSYSINLNLPRLSGDSIFSLDISQLLVVDFFGNDENFLRLSLDPFAKRALNFLGIEAVKTDSKSSSRELMTGSPHETRFCALHGANECVRKHDRFWGIVECIILSAVDGLFFFPASFIPPFPSLPLFASLFCSRTKYSFPYKNNPVIREPQIADETYTSL